MDCFSFYRFNQSSPVHSSLTSPIAIQTGSEMILTPTMEMPIGHSSPKRTAFTTFGSGPTPCHPGSAGSSTVRSNASTPQTTSSTSAPNQSPPVYGAKPVTGVPTTGHLV